MKSKCASCEFLISSQSSSQSLYNQKSLKSLFPRSPKPKSRIVVKRYEIKQEPVR